MWLSIAHRKRSPGRGGSDLFGRVLFGEFEPAADAWAVETASLQVTVAGDDPARQPCPRPDVANRVAVTRHHKHVLHDVDVGHRHLADARIGGSRSVFYAPNNLRFRRGTY
jgi:hypothetical protein